MVGIVVGIFQCAEIGRERSLMALQMFWQSNLKRRNNAPPLGLKNLGNSCYLNSVLQCLTYTPPLANFCLKSQHSSLCDSAAERDKNKTDCPFCILEKRIALSLRTDQTLDAPLKIIKCLTIFAEHFRVGRQEDAHEFLRYVIDACHNASVRLKKLQQQQQLLGLNAVNGDSGGEGFDGNSVVMEIFGGALQSQVKCLSCGAESNKVDEIMDISLDVLHCSSLKEALHKFFQAEVLDGNNKYKCDSCKKLVSARKQMSILQAPNVLVIQLKRFEGIYGGKIDKAITFEEVLVLSSYMCKVSHSQDPHPEYKLFATIVHSGFSPDSGHYYAYIKDASSHWYRCDDTFVSLSTLQKVLSEKVYILFFSRTKRRPVTADTSFGMNGTKSNGCKGSDTSKLPKTGHSIKEENIKQFVNHSLDKGNSATSAADKLPSSSPMNLNSFGNSGTKQLVATANVKLTFHKRENSENNGDAKTSNFTKKIKNNNLQPLKDKNGFAKSSGDAVDGERSVSAFSASGKEKIQSISLSSSIVKCKVGGISTGRGPDHKVLQNGSVSCLTDEVGGSKQKIRKEDSCTSFAEKSHAKSEEFNSKRKLREENLCISFAEDAQSHENHEELNSKRRGDNSCISFAEDEPHAKLEESRLKLLDKNSCLLFPEDAQSRAKLEDLKESLEKEAFLVLRSCGWSDEVHNFMRSKRLCAWGADNGVTNRDDLKRSLIEDAKLTCISQIPEPLKGSLINRLRLFSQEKQCSSP